MAAIMSTGGAGIGGGIGSGAGCGVGLAAIGGASGGVTRRGVVGRGTGAGALATVSGTGVGAGSVFCSAGGRITTFIGACAIGPGASAEGFLGASPITSACSNNEMPIHSGILRHGVLRTSKSWPITGTRLATLFPQDHDVARDRDRDSCEREEVPRE
jgi:hypothetical protein